MLHLVISVILMYRTGYQLENKICLPLFFISCCWVLNLFCFN